jgi:trypsin
MVLPFDRVRLGVALVMVFAVPLGCMQRSYNSTPKIVSGVLVDENDPVYTSTVSLDSNGKPFCSGFVLDKRTIVTAAHCLAGTPGRVTYSVTFGSKNRSQHKTMDVPAKQVMAHPGWDRGDLNRKNIDPMPQQPKNDVGVLVLSEDAPAWVKPLPIKEIGEVAAGREVLLAGFGQTLALPQDGSGAEFAGFLRKTMVKLATINDAGKELIWEAPRENIRASSCHGDSGGPMFFIEDNGALTVIGVTSRAYAAAIDCREKGVYTDVRKFADWIRSTRDKLASGVVNTGDWLHRNFTAKDGSKISLDFKLSQAGPDYLAEEVWLNVFNPAFTGKESVSSTLSSYINSLTQEELKMEYAGSNRFTVKFGKFTKEKVCAIASRWGIKQDIAIQVDGKSLMDQSNGDEAFVFKFCE